MKKLLLIFLSFFLISCGGVIRTTKTIFQGEGHVTRGTISVVAADPKINQSLAFIPKKKNIESHLMAVGYKVVNASDNPKYLAFVSYGIDNGKETLDSVPVFGQTGGGTTYHSGTVNTYGGGFGSYSGTSYSMPTYGIVGSSTVSRTEYARHLDIDIVVAKSLSTNVERMYEIRAKSSGSCSTIESVFESMTKVIFNKFPGENGKPLTMDVDWDGKC